MKVRIKSVPNSARNAPKWHGLGGNLYDLGGDTVGEWINTIYQNNPKEDYLGEPAHHYDFTQSEEWTNAHGYYPDARGHRDDRVKKPAHPSHSSRGVWDGDKFVLSELGMQNPNYTLFGLNDGGQDPQATLIYKGGNVIPETTVTPSGNYIFNPYDNIKIKFANGGHIYDGIIEPTQQMDNSYSYIKPLSEVIVDNEGNVRDPEVPSARGTIQLPEVTVSAPDRKDMVRRYNIASNDAITVANGRPVNTHLRKAFDEGAKAQAAWTKEHPWLETAGLIAGAAPLAVAATPAIVGGGELAYPILTNPYVDAGITSAFAGHGLNHTINEGINGWGDAAMTALEVAPLGRLAKPVYGGVIQPGMRLFNSPLTGNWTTIGNRQYRLNPNSLGANGALLESRSITPQITAENAAENGMGSSIGSINVEHSLDNISRFEGSSPIPTGHQGMVGYRPKQRTAVWDSAKQDMVPLKSIDEVPNLRKTIDSILRRIKTEDIRPEFLNENAYVNAFRDNATRQGININDLSHEDVAKILTEQYNQLREGSSGILRDNILWRTWGRTVPPNEFNWQEHLGEFTQNKGFWGEGNYFGTGVYGSSIANQPYMINDITAVGYDDLLGATTKAGDAIREGKNVGSQLSTGWMSESPNTRIVAATENGARNRYGWLDTGDQGIEIVTQKNTGIKALNPDLTIGNGETFPRDWSNPNVFKGLLPLLGLGAAGTLYGKQE